MKPLFGIGVCVLISISTAVTAQIDLRDQKKEVGPAVYCEGAASTWERSDSQLRFTTPISGTYELGTKVPIEVELRNNGKADLLVPTEPAVEKLISDKEPVPIELVEMCFHPTMDVTFAERCLSGRISKPDSIRILRPGESMTFADSVSLVLIKPESYLRATQDGYTFSTRISATFSLIRINGFPRKLYKDCFAPLYDSTPTELVSITVTAPKASDKQQEREN